MARKRTCSNAVLGGLMAVGLLVGGTGQVKAQPSYIFTTLTPPNSLQPIAYGINGAGQIVGDYLDPDLSQVRVHGFLLSGGSYTTLDVPGWPRTLPKGSTPLG